MSLALKGILVCVDRGFSVEYNKIYGNRGN